MGEERKGIITRGGGEGKGKRGMRGGKSRKRKGGGGRVEDEGME